MTSETRPYPHRRTVGHGLRAWYGRGPRRHGEPIAGRTVSYVELFYDLVFVVLVGQAAGALAAQPGWRGAAEFATVFGLVWIAWINGTLYHELHGREDGRSRTYIFAQMCVLAVLAVFTGHAGNADGRQFALTYAVLLVLLWWQWYEVRRRDHVQNRSLSTPYLAGLLVTIVVMLATSGLPEAPRLAAWAAVVLGWVVLGSASVLSRAPGRSYFQATGSLVERLALFVIIVLGETVVGVVGGVTETAADPLTLLTAVLGLGVGFGLWWTLFDVVGVREPRPARTRLMAWLFCHLPLSGTLAAAGAAMVGLVAHAHAPRTPPPVAWTLGGAVALGLVLVAALSATVVRDPEELPSSRLALVLGTGACAVLAVAAFTPPAWLLALVVLAVLSGTWLTTFVPRPLPPDAA